MMIVPVSVFNCFLVKNIQIFPPQSREECLQCKCLFYAHRQTNTTVKHHPDIAVWIMTIPQQSMVGSPREQIGHALRIGGAHSHIFQSQEQGVCEPIHADVAPAAFSWLHVPQRNT